VNTKIKNIVIVGGGTAGWTTALNFLQKTISPKITVIASKEIPIIGVGESTTGRFNGLINLKSGFINIDEADFLKKTGSTFKIGIMHSDWHTIGESFTSPLGDDFINELFYPSIGYDYSRIFHVAKNKKYDSYTQSQMMLNNKLPYFEITKDCIFLNDSNVMGKVDYKFNHEAYHLDTYKVGQYIKDVVTKNERVTYLDDTVVDIEKNESGFLKNVKTNTGKIIEGDLFVDCSGFSRLLIEKQFNNNFISYEDELIVNRALPFHIQNKKDTVINNYTHVTAKKYGWLWDIPLQERKGCGYVYNDSFISPEQAQQEIEKDLGFKIYPQKDIKFKAGRLEKFWCKNVISTGLASAFVEPLEATSIHMTVLQINHFIEQYYTEYMNFNCEFANEQYNKEMTSVWDDIKDFIVMHYITPRNDTNFWKEASSPKRHSKNLKNKLEIWKSRMPRESDYQGSLFNTFYHLGNSLWYQILIGMNLLDSKKAQQELETFNLLKYVENSHAKKLLEVKWIVENSVDNNLFYKNIEMYLKDYKKIHYKTV
jgi:tryptophan halogenase